MADSLMYKRVRSGPAVWYRVRADVRGRRLAAGSVVLVVALATLLSGLALAVSASAQAPFDRLFTRLNGAHLWVYFLPQSAPTQGQLDAVVHAPNVAASTELEEADGHASVLIASQKLGAYIQTFPVQQPAIGQLLIMQGHGLATGDPDGVILSQPFADAQRLQVGSALTLVTPVGLAQVHVRGLSIDVNQVNGNGAAQATIYMLRPTFKRLYPQPDRWVVGLRLVDPYAIRQTTQTILQRLQAQGYTDKYLWDYDWQGQREMFAFSSQLTIILLLMFGIVGLLSAGVIVANLVIGQVLAQQRDLGVLKAIGFTPWQLVRILVLEYLLLGLLGALVGLLFVAPITPLLLTAIGASLGAPALPQYNLGIAALLVLAILLVIAVCALLPARLAGHTRVVDALRPGGAVAGRGRARLAGLMFVTGLPVVLALAIRGIAARPLRTWLVALTLLLGVLTAVFGLGLGATLDTYTHDPALNGIFADVYVSPGLYDPAATLHLLSSRPEVAYYYSTYQTSTQLSDGRVLELLFTGGDPRRIAAAVSNGRWFHADANELVISQYALHQLGWRIGEQIPLPVNVHVGLQVMTPVTITFTVVGTLARTQQPMQAYVPLQSLIATRAITTNQLLEEARYEVTLQSGVSPQTFEHRMNVLTADRLGIGINDLSLPSGIAQAPMIMLFLSIALMLVGGVGILNAMALSIRERSRELASLKAVGLTPRQVLVSVINGAVALGIVAALVGIPLGLWLTAVLAQGISDSVGGPSNLQISINWVGLGLLLPATMCVAALGAYLPAYWAARIPAAEVLRYE